MKNIKRWDPSRSVVQRSTIEGCEKQAAKLFKVLAAGHLIHRRNCDHFGFAWNGPLHSAVPKLEEMYDLPVERQLIAVESPEGPVKVKEFWFSEETLAALDDIEQRQSLAEDTRRRREHGYIAQTIGRAKTLVTVLTRYGKLVEFHPELMAELRELALMIDALPKE